MTTTDRLAEVDLAAINLVDPQTYLDNDMAAVWRSYRRQEPIFRHRGVDGQPGFWVVSRHHDNSAIYRDSRRFTIERGNMLSTLLAGGDSAGGRMVSVADGPRHRDLRGVILKAFSQRALDYVAERVRAYTRELITEAVDRGGCDFAQDIAARIPINTICDLLGIPEPDRPQLLELNKRAVSSDEPGHTELDARMARSEIVMYFTELVQDRAGRQGDDVISLLAGTRVDGEYLSGHDVVLNCYGLLVAGEETSRCSMIGGVHALATHPAEWARLRAGEVGLDTATEEVLRWSTPVMHVGRTATEDVELDGTTIRSGDIVTLWASSANSDGDVFDDPDTLDLGRSPNKHLTFGFGPHFCLGVFLARAEISAVLDALRTHASAVELAGPPRRIYSNVLNGFSRLPVSFAEA
jgi:cytochrome P450